MLIVYFLFLKMNKFMVGLFLVFDYFELGNYRFDCEFIIVYRGMNFSWENKLILFNFFVKCLGFC